MRVLLIDDASDLRFLIRECLEQDGRFEIVGEAGDGRRAIELAESTGPEAIVLDLALPGMDGLELIPELRRVAPGCRILVLSGFSASRMSEQALELGVDAYMEKSLDMVSEIAKRLASVVSAPPPPASQ